MSMLPVLSARKVKKLKFEIQKIGQDQTALSTAHHSLKETSAQIDQTITVLKDRDFKEHNKMLDELNLEDKYKTDLKGELETSRKECVDTLTPLREQSERLRGNMIVTQEKALQHMAVVKARMSVMECGKIQLDVIKTLQEKGKDLQGQIDSLLEETENINKVTKQTIASFNSVGGGSLFEDSIVGS